MPVGRAAGGLLWRDGPSGPRLALVHRPKRDDWSLPKGKLDDGEGWEEAALREVEEETGCRARIISFAGATSYLARRAPKVVLYWHMALVREGRLDAGDEIDEVAWLAPADAVRRLDYEADRRLVARARPAGAAGAAPSPAAAAVAAERADVQRRLLELDDRGQAAGLGPALELLDRADEAAARGDGRELRLLLAAARRLALLSADEPERASRARALREQARRLSSWRRAAVRSVLSAEGKASPEALYVAAEICDQEAERRVDDRPWPLLAAGGLAAAGAGLALVASWDHAGASAAIAGGAAGLAGAALYHLAAGWWRRRG
ncbi:MAG TPA: NUDIX hydrolase [Anaeromyxobacteraceae bacterium]|nr:NUDIX hydrolase [Anaeromyxobacteraceae bacterium]